MNSKELHDHVRTHVDIIDSIRKYIPLKEECNFFIGTCPFCKGVDLFLASKNSHAFFCFSCFATGDVMDFVAKIGGMRKDTAARFLDTLNKIKGEVDVDNKVVGQ